MIHTRQFTSSLAIRDGGDGRTLVGPLLPWGVTAQVVDQGRLVTETFTRGALDGTDPATVPLTATHPRDAGTLPIGVTLTIEDRSDAAYGSWRVSDTHLGNEVLALARDGVPLGLSVGFAEVPGGSRWSADRQRVTRTRAALDHVAVVRVPAYAGAGVAGVRDGGQHGAAPTPTLLTLLRCRGQGKQARWHEERRRLPGFAQPRRAALPVLQAPHRMGRTLRGLQAGTGRAPTPQAPMSRNLLRPCLGCGRQVRGKPRCADCTSQRDQLKRVRRPDLHNDAAERRRRREAVADHRAIVGDWCPGWERRPAHPSADLTADHVKEVGAGGRPDGRLVVRCRSCNAARSAHLAARVLSRMATPDPRAAEPPITHRDDDPGPVAA